MTTNTTSYVYFLYDITNSDLNRVLYIGKTDNLESTIFNHFTLDSRQQNNWKLLIDKTRIMVFEFNNYADLDIYYIYFIRKYNPLHNEETNIKRLFKKPTFDLPYIEPINYFEDIYNLINKYNTEFNETQKLTFNKLFSDSIFFKLAKVNNETGNLEIKFDFDKLKYREINN